MSRIWVYIKESTFRTAVDVMKWWGHHSLSDRKAAVDDLKSAKKLSDTGATHSEIEHATQVNDETQKE